MTVAVAIGAASLAAWTYLLIARGGFWRMREADRELPLPLGDAPAVTVIIPARDEAALIADAVASVLAQSYPGPVTVVVVDDASSDGTGALARAAGAEVVATRGPPPGWTGKLAAVAAGIGRAETTWLWLTDADIVHRPDALSALMAGARADDLVLHSTMVRLRTDTLAERAIVPAFVFFFAKLFPFARVNRPGPTAAAAGGSTLVHGPTLARAGGLSAIRGAIIDDCALGALMKRHGRIRLALTERSASRRACGWRPLFTMVARSAYAQLGFAPARLAGAVAGMALVYVAPAALALAATGPARALGLIAWLAMAVAFQPTLRQYGRSPAWGAALPAIAAFYLAATLASAWNHARGLGGMWKGRAQAHAAA